jgi:hypothetical protein
MSFMEAVLVLLGLIALWILRKVFAEGGLTVTCDQCGAKYRPTDQQPRHDCPSEDV